MSSFVVWALRLGCVAYAVIIISWGLPGGSLPLQAELNSKTINGLHVLGLWQGWDMFAPNPFSLNARVRARFSTAAGETYDWVFPAPGPKWGLERWRRERFRKWAVDHVRIDNEKHLWDGALAFAQANLEAETKLKFVRGELHRDWKEIQSPRENFMTMEEVQKAHRWDDRQPASVNDPKQGTYKFYEKAL